MVGDTNQQLALPELGLLIPISDSPSGEVVSRYFNLNTVSRKNADVVLAHFAA